MIYFCHNPDSNAIKIGFTKSPGGRLAELQLCSPAELEYLLLIPGGNNLEKQLHMQFRSDWIRGEWFAYSDEIKTFILGHLAEHIDYKRDYALEQENREKKKEERSKMRNKLDRYEYRARFLKSKPSLTPAEKEEYSKLKEYYFKYKEKLAAAYKKNQLPFGWMELADRCVQDFYTIEDLEEEKYNIIDGKRVYKKVKRKKKQEEEHHNE
jgi:hypothetical protein